jgi:AcrR family transcriptional regulator
MPIMGDKDERHAQLVAVAFDLVADKGIEALTFRELAPANGCSTSIVSHYFRNKNELLFKVYQVGNERAKERLAADYEAGDSLLACFDAILPVDEASRRNGQVWLAFWSRAPGTSLPRRTTPRSRGQSCALSPDAGAPLGVDASFSALDIRARRLIAAVVGIGLGASLAPADWTTARRCWRQFFAILSPPPRT